VNPGFVAAAFGNRSDTAIALYLLSALEAFAVAASLSATNDPKRSFQSTSSRFVEPLRLDLNQGPWTLIVLYLYFKEMRPDAR
jgi:hypothetical protein